MTGHLLSGQAQGTSACSFSKVVGKAGIAPASSEENASTARRAHCTAQLPREWCARSDSNRDCPFGTPDFETGGSTFLLRAHGALPRTRTETLSNPVLSGARLPVSPAGHVESTTTAMSKKGPKKRRGPGLSSRASPDRGRWCLRQIVPSRLDENSRDSG